MNNRLHTVSEVAKVLGVNPNAVYELIKHGHIKALKLGSLKVSTFELEDFLRRSAGLDYSDLKCVSPL
ncbi:helix-turn-helix domain-containing protein [Cohnella sp. GCM10012308]|uniref:helix-turn-helix domain-containing protein n=1 Tax=Cohnella sp. GCM10012308 TaxID=3317329 RepID=UPI00360F9DA4